MGRRISRKGLAMDFEWIARVSSRERDKAHVFVRKHSFPVGSPLSFDQEYDSVTALEYVWGAIGADLVNGIKKLAKTHRLLIEDVEALVQVSLNNSLTYLGVIGETGNPGIKCINIKFYVNSNESRKRIENLWKETLSKSPLFSTLKSLVEFDLKLTRQA